MLHIKYEPSKHILEFLCLQTTDSLWNDIIKLIRHTIRTIRTILTLSLTSYPFSLQICLICVRKSICLRVLQIQFIPIIIRFAYTSYVQFVPLAKVNLINLLLSVIILTVEAHLELNATRA